MAGLTALDALVGAAHLVVDVHENVKNAQADDGRRPEPDENRHLVAVGRCAENEDVDREHNRQCRGYEVVGRLHNRRCLNE